MQSELAAPCGWINMWAGRNKKTYERQHLSVLRVNKRLCMTLLLLLGLEVLAAACTCHSGNAWNRRERFKFYLEMLFGFINYAVSGKAC